MYGKMSPELEFSGVAENPKNCSSNDANDKATKGKETSDVAAEAIKPHTIRAELLDKGTGNERTVFTAEGEANRNFIAVDEVAEGTNEPMARLQSGAVSLENAASESTGIEDNKPTEPVNRRGSLGSNEDAVEVAMQVVREVQEHAEENSVESSPEPDVAPTGNVNEDDGGPRAGSLGLALGLGQSNEGLISQRQNNEGCGGWTVGGSGSAPRDAYTYDGDSHDSEPDDKIDKEEDACQSADGGKDFEQEACQAEVALQVTDACRIEESNVAASRSRDADSKDNGPDADTASERARGGGVQDIQEDVQITSSNAADIVPASNSVAASEERDSGAGQEGGDGALGKQGLVEKLHSQPLAPAAEAVEANGSKPAQLSSASGEPKLDCGGTVSRKRPRDDTEERTKRNVMWPPSQSRPVDSKLPEREACVNTDVEVSSKSSAGSVAVKGSGLPSGVGSTKEAVGLGTASSIAAASAGPAEVAESSAVGPSPDRAGAGKLLAMHSTAHMPDVTGVGRLVAYQGAAGPEVLGGTLAVGAEVPAVKTGFREDPEADAAAALGGTIAQAVAAQVTERVSEREGTEATSAGAVAKSSGHGVSSSHGVTEGVVKLAAAAAVAAATAVADGLALRGGGGAADAEQGPTGTANGHDGTTNAAAPGGTSTEVDTPATISASDALTPVAANTTHVKSVNELNGDATSGKLVRAKPGKEEFEIQGDTCVEAAINSGKATPASPDGDSVCSPRRTPMGVGWGSQQPKARLKEEFAKMPTLELEMVAAADQQAPPQAMSGKETFRGSKQVEGPCLIDLNLGMSEEAAEGVAAGVQQAAVSRAVRPVPGTENVSLHAALGLGKGAFGPEDGKLRSDSGWKGPGLMSAFRAPDSRFNEPRSTDVEAGQLADRTNPCRSSGPARAPLEFDLNVTDERALEDAGMALASSYGSVPAHASQGGMLSSQLASGSLSGVMFRRDHSISVGPTKRELDLNLMDESEDLAQSVGLKVASVAAGEITSPINAPNPPLTHTCEREIPNLFAQTLQQEVPTNQAISSSAPTLSLGPLSRQSPSSFPPSSTPSLPSSLAQSLLNRASSPSKVVLDFDLNDGPSLEDASGSGPSINQPSVHNLELPSGLVQSLLARLATHNQAQQNDHDLSHGDPRAASFLPGPMTLGGVLASGRGALGSGKGLGGAVGPGAGEAGDVGLSMGAKPGGAGAQGGAGGNGATAPPRWLSPEARALTLGSPRAYSPSQAGVAPAGTASLLPPSGSRSSHVPSPQAIQTSGPAVTLGNLFALQANKAGAPPSGQFPAGFPFASVLSNNLGLGSAPASPNQLAAAAALFSPSFQGIATAARNPPPRTESLKAVLQSAGGPTPGAHLAEANLAASSSPFAAMLAMAGARAGHNGLNRGRSGSFPSLDHAVSRTNTGSGAGLRGVGGAAGEAGRQDWDLNSGPEGGRDAQRGREFQLANTFGIGNLGSGGGAGGIGNAGASGGSGNLRRTGGSVAVLEGGGAGPTAGILAMGRSADPSQEGASNSVDNPGGRAWLLEHMTAYQQMAAAGMNKRKETEGGSDPLGGPLKQLHPSWRWG